MKKFILLSLVLFSCSLISFGQSKRELKKLEKQKAKKEVVRKKKFVGDPNTPITFKTKFIDLKDIPYGSENLFSFEFTNTGVDTLEIKGVRTSCGCTQAKKPDAPLSPGESAVIEVSYDSKRVGIFVKDVYVITNKTETITLTIKGSVLPKPAEEQTDEF